MHQPKTFTPAQLAQARRMHADNIPWARIGREFGVSDEVIRRHAQPGYRERRNQQSVNAGREQRLRDTLVIDRSSVNIIGHRPHPDLIAAAMKRANAPRSLSAHYFGDPPQGYSALDGFVR